MIKDLLLDILFPKFCLGCGREGKYICDKCNVFISEVEPLHQNKFGAGQAYYFEQEKYGLDALISIWEYDGLIKKLIHEIKYQGLFDIIKELVSLIDIKIYYPYITYVPMYKKREKRRGFNQAELIAKELAKKVEVCPLPLLEKIKDTKPQMGLSQEQRLENIKDSFRFVGAGLPCPDDGGEETSPLQNVLLVDDVFTTGATMKECAKVLKKAGIKKVWGFVLARTA